MRAVGRLSVGSRVSLPVAVLVAVAVAAVLSTVVWGGPGALGVPREGRGERPAATAASGVATDPAPPRSRGVASGSVAGALGLLSAWDRARAAAYVDGDRRRLAGLYRPGSAAGAADLALLRHYGRAGVRVRRMQTQLLGIDVLDVGERRLRLRVTDRVLARARGPQGPVVLRSTGRSTRTVVFRRPAGGTWRVSAVRP